MSRLFATLLLALACLPGAARALYTETLPQGVFLLDARYAWSRAAKHWTDEGEPGPMLDEVVRYEPGGGWQGTLVPSGEARFSLLINMLNYGITDALSAVVAVPVVLRTTVNPDLGWIPGDYSAQLGRPYSEQDFWEWAGSMGQPQPGVWVGNQGTLGDIVLGGRFRFSDHLPAVRSLGLELAVTGYGSILTGSPPDPEEIVAAGTNSFNLHTQGEYGLHLSVEKLIGERLRVGLDLFHELLVPRRYTSGTGAIHPLLMNQRPFVGETYVIDPGDFTGVDVGVEVVAIRGPLWDTWLRRRTGGNTMPPLLTLSLRYDFTLVGQSDWRSDSPLWDWQQEKFWAPGYKNILMANATLSLLRLGVPLRLYVTWRNMTLLPGRNVRGPNALFGGVQLPLRFW